MFLSKSQNTDVTIKRWHRWVVGIIVLLTIVVNLYSFYWPRVRVQMVGQDIRVVVADTNKHRLRGLSGRDDFRNTGGLLFVFPQSGIHTMVMRDMKMPIDVVWIATASDNHKCRVGSYFRQLFFGVRPTCKGVVVEIAPNIQPEPGKTEIELKKYFSTKNSTMVLELPAGWTEQNGLKIGDLVQVR